MNISKENNFMSKIKQAWSWLAKNDKAASIEKRGDLTIQQIIGIAVSVIVVGLVAAILVILVRNAGQDASDRAEGVSQAVAGDPAIYNATCSTTRGLRVATIARVETSPGSAQHIDIPWAAAGGYGVPTAGFNATAATVGRAGTGVLSVDNGTRVGFFAAASRLTESRHNADFDGNGEIDAIEVVGVIETAAADMNDIVPNATTPAATSDSHAATDAGAGAFMLADPTADINANNAPNLAVGRQLIVNNTDSCWRIV